MPPSANPPFPLAIDAKAKALKASGSDVIGFGAGEPDFPTPAHIVEAAAAACADPRNHKYSPAAGLPELRAAVATKTRRDSAYDVTPAQVLITNGGKQAVEQSFAVLVDPGDEVIVPAPYWTTYPEAIGLAGGTPVVLTTTGASGFKVTVDQLESVRTERTKVLLFVSPSNPTGAVYGRDEIAAIGQWAVQHGIWVVTDEIYEHLVYGDARFESMPVVVPELADTCVIINGVAKTYAMTGWRVGWMIGPPDVIAATANLQSHTTSNVCNVAQRAALAAVEGPLDAVGEMRATYDRRRQTILEMLRQIDGVECVEPEGGVLRLPQLRGGPRAQHRRQDPGVHPGAGRDRPRSGQRSVRARGGVRGARLRPVLLRPGRRRHGGGRQPGSQAARLNARWRQRPEAGAATGVPP